MSLRELNIRKESPSGVRIKKRMAKTLYYNPIFYMNFGPDPKKESQILRESERRTFAKYCTDFFRA